MGPSCAHHAQKSIANGHLAAPESCIHLTLAFASLMHSSKSCPRQRWLFVQCRHVLCQPRGDHLIELTHIVTTALQEKNMEVKPDYGYDTYVGHNKLKDKVTICHAFLHCACEELICRRPIDTPLFKDLPSAVALLTPLTLAVAGRNNHWR